VRVREEESRSARLAALRRLDAVRPGLDPVLQELVEEARDSFGVEVCMVNLTLSDVQYLRAWSGEAPAGLAETRRASLERSMCRYVVDAEAPLVVEDLLATDGFREQHLCVDHGVRFYAGTPLVTSDGITIGTLCLWGARPKRFGEERTRLLGAYARAATARLELLGAVRREEAVREEAQRGRQVAAILDGITDAFFALDHGGRFTYVNREAERLLNRPREELVGRDMREEFRETVGPAFHRELRRALEEGITVAFEELYSPLGTTLAVRASPSETGLSVYLRDATGRKRA
jgi:PAS domain S-box-containing protein